MFIYIVLVLIILYLLAIMPKMFNRHDLSSFKGYYYAHRGLHLGENVAPENSIAAFNLAVKKNYGIEFDVQLSKDGIPVVFHDSSLKRICGIDKYIDELTFNELRELKVLNSNEKIPHLKEVLELVNCKVPLIIELKTRSNDTSVCPVVAEILDNYKGIYCIESFNPLAVFWYKKNRPHIIRGQLSTNHLKGKHNKALGFLLQNLLFNFLTKPDFIAFDHLYDSMMSFKICKALYKPPTVAYTIKSLQELNEKANKFDLIIFENFIP